MVSNLISNAALVLKKEHYLLARPRNYRNSENLRKYLLTFAGTNFANIPSQNYVSHEFSIANRVRQRNLAGINFLERRNF